MNLRRLYCRLFNHRVSHPDLIDYSKDLCCIRCGKVLAAVTRPAEIPSHLRFDRTYTNGCHGKTRFSSHRQAEERMARMKVRPATLHPYHCHHCGGVHLGNSKHRR
jgi:hypothetical protein